MLFMKTPHFSTVIIDLVRKNLEQDQLITEALIETLKISLDAAYRRINNKVDLTLEEALKLCKRYKISIDGIASINEEKILFGYFALFNEHFTKSYNEYLLTLEASLNGVISGNGKFYVSASDIPIGFMLRYPKLMAFKLYCWQNDMIVSS